jgi:hypothetical protein
MAARTRTRLGSNVKAVGSSKGLTELGKIAMFTLPDEPKSGTDLVRAWGGHGLPMDFLPDKREAVHVFQSACRSVETRRANGSAKRVEVKVDEVLHNAKECVYQITRLVRGAVRELLQSLGAQNLRRKAGGVYFVPAEYLPPHGNGSRKKQPTGPLLDGIQGALADLYGDRADFYTIPLVNDEDARAMVAKHFTINVTEQSKELVTKVVNRVRAGKGRTVRADLVANLWNERRKIAGAVDDFTALVDFERAELDANLRDIDKAIGELQELAET